jgi:hypothetical protein
VVLVHNEVNILADFMAHYRRMGPVQFLVIEDGSDDGSRGFLEAQPDVSIFTPKPGSTYEQHKRAWRSETLDLFGTGRWCLVPDADEHLVWRGAETRPFERLIGDLEAEGAEGLAATMVDMYADRPIADHVGGGGRLLHDFPLFDDPLLDPLAYRLQLSKPGFHRKFGTPDMIATGGMRDRVFFAPSASHNMLGRVLLRNSIRKSRTPRGRVYFRERVIATLTQPRRGTPPLNLTKLPLLRWPRGAKFNGGTHHLSRRLPLSCEHGVLMHFAITRGMDGIRYIAERGQHAKQGTYYRAMSDLGHVNPVYHGTSRYRDSESFRGFFE